MALLESRPSITYPNWELARMNGIEVYVDKTRPNRANPQSTEYLWPMTLEEARLVRELLCQGEDFNPPSTWVVTPQYKCAGCGRKSGFADSVHTALEDKVHLRELMIKAVNEKLPNTAPPRIVR